VYLPKWLGCDFEVDGSSGDVKLSSDGWSGDCVCCLPFGAEHDKALLGMYIRQCFSAATEPDISVHLVEGDVDACSLEESNDNGTKTGTRMRGVSHTLLLDLRSHVCIGTSLWPLNLLCNSQEGLLAISCDNVSWTHESKSCDCLSHTVSVESRATVLEFTGNFPCNVNALCSEVGLWAGSLYRQTGI